MSLLSEADKAQIRGAIKLVTETFFVTPVQYFKKAVSFDRFNEDRKDRYGQPYDLSALVEFDDASGNWAKEDKDGAIDQAEIKVTLNVQDLIPMGLIDPITKLHKFEKAEDKFIVYGTEYIVLYADFEGPLDTQNILVGIYGVKRKAGG